MLRMSYMKRVSVNLSHSLLFISHQRKAICSAITPSFHEKILYDYKEYIDVTLKCLDTKL